MRWNNLTGLEAETQKERQLIRKSMWQFASMFGRSMVVALLGFVTITSIAGLPESAQEGLTAGLMMETALGSISALDFAFLFAFAWALAPGAFSLYRLWRLRGLAKRGITIEPDSELVWP